jgi:SAM-dependent methyltransferase
VVGKDWAVTAGRTFDELVAEGAAVPTDGWDFSWFAGRATEQRPSWGYARLIGERMAQVSAALDIQTGGGEVLASIPKPPAVLAATESWPPNLDIARRNLTPLGGQVHAVPDDADLPFPDESFELVMSRHPTVTVWPEIARVLKPGGSYLSQQVGKGTMQELTDFMMGPQVPGEGRSTASHVAAATAAGLEVVDLRSETLLAEFFDVAAVVHFLRKVLWTVPDFTVERYHDRLVAMHEHILAEGRFVAHTQRFLIEARKLAPGS